MRAVLIGLILLAASGEATAGVWEDVAAEGRRTAGRARTSGVADSVDADDGEARMWFRLAGEWTRMGLYDSALDAYERALALGDADPAALVNSAELLMAKGRAREAIDRYGEAVAIEERELNRREHLHGLALGYFGLAVALDRDGHAVAAREAIGRALAFDPGLAVLRLAGQPDSEVFFVPKGEVHYYLALAREAQGRADDAATAFRDYLRVSTGPYVGRAREHLARLMTGGGEGGAPDRSPRQQRGSAARRDGAPGDGTGAGSNQGWRVLHQATVFTDGPLVAPLIDAAWRLHPRLLASCLVDLPPLLGGPGAPGGEVKLSVEMRIDDSGRVGAATVKVSAALGESLPACIEQALVDQFRVSRAPRRKPTLVRMEVILAPARSGGV